jgi:hypothetical protein
MICSHRVPYERQCLFCFREAMEVERLREQQQKDWQSVPHAPPLVSLKASLDGHILSSCPRDIYQLRSQPGRGVAASDDCPPMRPKVTEGRTARGIA